ncbi:lysophosphatidic acid receptor 6-like [Paramacrobiotus metropolitanus]|uniref:lysophosphatidic acid receptor 6-like n=1 Tax=Paramacrobiotus metropolitanus TaxID=2943436 RepID=UPI0024460963|nr:lysophosphatidic acid receptor 6-like [Paramacrobiotus metropolitanus]
MNNTSVALLIIPSVLSTWNSLQTCTSLICVAVYILNGFLLYLFLRRRYLRTVFSIYILTITISQILNAVFQNPLLFVVRDYVVHGKGDTFCMVYLYLKQTIGTSLPSFHMLVALNRIWALCYPMSYRHRHTKKLAGVLCAGTWLFIHVVVVPGLFMEGLYFRTRQNNFLCTFSTGDPKMEYWSITVTITLSIVPEVVILLFYPFALWKRRQRRKKIKEITLRSSTDEARGSTKSVHSFMVLTLLTVSTTVCWTPTNAYFVAMKYFPNVTFMEAAVTLKLLHTAVDPVLFIVAWSDLRQAARDAVQWGVRKVPEAVKR